MSYFMRCLTGLLIVVAASPWFIPLSPWGWALASALIMTLGLAIHPCGSVSRRVRRSRSRFIPWRQLVAGVAVAMVTVTALIGITAVQSSFPLWTDWWSDRDRYFVEAAIAKSENSSEWDKAGTTILNRLERPASPTWRQTLLQRLAQNQLYAAAAASKPRPAFEQIRQGWRKSVGDDQLVDLILRGITATDENLRLSAKLVALQEELQVRTTTAADAHVETLLSAAHEIWRYPTDAKVLLDQATDLDRRFHLSSSVVVSANHDWTPAAELSPDTSIRVIRHRQIGRVAAIDLSATTDAGQHIAGLQSQDFALAADETPLRHFIVEERQQATDSQQLAIVLDCSSSTAGTPHAASVSGASHLAKALDGRVRMRLWSFADAVTAASDWTSTSSDIIAKISTLKPQGRTALLRAISAAASDLSQQPGRSTLVLFADGKDTVGGPDVDALLRFCQECKIRIDVVALQSQDLDLPLLERFAVATGGRLLMAEKVQSLVSLFEEVTDDLLRPIYRLTVLFDSEPPPVLVLRVGTGKTIEFNLHHMAQTGKVSE